MVELDYKSGIPIYDQIVSGIVKLKVMGALKGGDALPSVRALAIKLGINPNTVQRAYAILEEKGIIYSVSGKGSFISGDASAHDALDSLALKEFKKAVEEAKRMGKSADELKKVIDFMFKEAENDRN